jgi:hypothetical protein
VSNHDKKGYVRTHDTQTFSLGVTSCETSSNTSRASGYLGFSCENASLAVATYLDIDVGKCLKVRHSRGLGQRSCSGPAVRFRAERARTIRTTKEEGRLLALSQIAMTNRVVPRDSSVVYSYRAAIAVSLPLWSSRRQHLLHEASYSSGQQTLPYVYMDDTARTK